MNINTIKGLADGTELKSVGGIEFTKHADGIYCPLNNHLYTWINLADGKMLKALDLRFNKADGKLK